MSSTQTPKSEVQDPILIDLGKKKRKDIKKLKKGKGKLFHKVSEVRNQLKASGLDENSGPLVVLVKQKKRKNKKFLGFPVY